MAERSGQQAKKAQWICTDPAAPQHLKVDGGQQSGHTKSDAQACLHVLDGMLCLCQACLATGTQGMSRELATPIPIGTADWSMDLQEPR